MTNASSPLGKIAEEDRAFLKKLAEKWDAEGRSALMNWEETAETASLMGTGTVGGQLSLLPDMLKEVLGRVPPDAREEMAARQIAHALDLISKQEEEEND